MDPPLSAFSRAVSIQIVFQFLDLNSFLCLDFKNQMHEFGLSNLDETNFARKPMKIPNHSHWFHTLKRPVAPAIK